VVITPTPATSVRKYLPRDDERRTGQSRARKEGPIVLLANAGVEPLAVMIKL
jgi:hypothetical protein